MDYTNCHSWKSLGVEHHRGMADEGGDGLSECCAAGRLGPALLGPAPLGPAPLGPSRPHSAPTAGLSERSHDESTFSGNRPKPRAFR